MRLDTKEKRAAYRACMVPKDSVRDQRNAAFDPKKFILDTAAADLRPFMGAAQFSTMRRCARGEEGDWFITRMVELAALILTMPKTYEQDGKGEAATAHLHYFTASADWYITEKDAETPEKPGQHQAFGLADLFGERFQGGGELGYISIVELIENGAELDLHWTPRTLAAVRERAA